MPQQVSPNLIPVRFRDTYRALTDDMPVRRTFWACRSCARERRGKRLNGGVQFPKDAFTYLPSLPKRLPKSEAPGSARMKRKARRQLGLEQQMLLPRPSNSQVVRLIWRTSVPPQSLSCIAAAFRGRAGRSGSQTYSWMRRWNSGVFPASIAASLCGT